MFTKSRAMVLSDGMLAVLADYAAKNQIKIAFAGGKLGDELTLKFRIVEADPQIAEKQAKDKFAREAFLVGLEPTDFGRRFRSFSGETYIVSAIDLKKRSYPVLAKRARDGKGFKFPAAQVTQNWIA